MRFFALVSFTRLFPIGLPPKLSSTSIAALASSSITIEVPVSRP